MSVEGKPPPPPPRRKSGLGKFGELKGSAHHLELLQSIQALPRRLSLGRRQSSGKREEAGHEAGSSSTSASPEDSSPARGPPASTVATMRTVFAGRQGGRPVPMPRNTPADLMFGPAHFPRHDPPAFDAPEHDDGHSLFVVDMPPPPRERPVPPEPPVALQQQQQQYYVPPLPPSRPAMVPRMSNLAFPPPLPPPRTSSLQNVLSLPQDSDPRPTGRGRPAAQSDYAAPPLPDDDIDYLLPPPPPPPVPAAPSRRPALSDVGLGADYPPVAADPYSGLQPGLATYNPHVLQRLAVYSPWAGMDVNHPQAQDVGRRMERLYVSPDAIKRLTHFRPKRTDVVVCGSVRAGQSVVLAALDSLRGSLFHDLGATTAWVENGHLEVEVPRLLKTHMGADQVLDSGDHGCKVVVVLRDPVDVRVSWFRHCRRLFRKLAKAKPGKFDEAFNFAVFSRLAMPHLGNFGGNAEHHIAFALKALDAKPSQVCLVFYEDILDSPRAVVDRLARFTGWGMARIQSTVDKLTMDPLHPSHGKHRGSTGAGASYLANNPDLAREFAMRWETAMKRALQKNPSLTYDTLRRRFVPGQPVLAMAVDLRFPKHNTHLTAVDGLVPLSTGSSRRGSQLSSAALTPTSSQSTMGSKRRSQSLHASPQTSFRIPNELQSTASSSTSTSSRPMGSFSKKGSFSFMMPSSRRMIATKEVVDPDDSPDEDAGGSADSEDDEEVVALAPGDSLSKHPGMADSSTPPFIVGHHGGRRG